MKTALIIGSSGLVGKHLVRLLLKENSYSKIRILVRSPQNYNSPRIEEILFDFDNPDENQVKGDDLYCCLGTTIKKAKTKEAFIKVDYQYPISIAKLAHANGAKKMAVITALGSDSKSKIFYNKVKGDVEFELKKIPFHALYIFKPSLLLGKREERRFAETIGKVALSVISPLLPKKIRGIHASKIAQSMIQETQKDREGIFIIESKEMQRFDIK
ncbi:MAG: NAD(P)H-binding protein [Salinivirgaceae bacterium]|nr:NAD(P)H-binding protein [Salinivirgaceae bacterium]MDD4746464.1 NAD(P)H-binding protein [Salinivirgaceae bacterium]MDY0281529.1 NAD(P)H-binding protein [Salinivirgaceae bacterium]